MQNGVNYLNHILFFLFLPVLLFVEHMGSFVYLLITILGIVFYSRDRRADLNEGEKKIIRWFSLFFMFSLVSVLYQYIINGNLYPETDNKLQVYLNFGVSFFVVISALRLKKPFEVLKLTLVVSAILLFVIGSYEFYILSRQPKGISHHLVYGDISNFVGVALLVLSLVEKESLYKKILFVAGILSLIACVYTGARGAWITWPVFMILLWFRLKEYRARITLISIATIVIFVMSYFIQSTGVAKRIDQAVIDISNYKNGLHKGSSLGARFEMWSASLDVIKEYPVMGVGVGGYQPSVQKITGNKIAATYYSPHNTYINALVTQGIIGLITVLGLFFSVAKLFYSGIYSKSIQTRSISYIAVLLVLSFMIYGLTVSTFDGMALSTMYVYMTALLIASLRKEVTE